MQSLNWYIRRLRAMSPGEVAWRFRGTLRDRLDRVRYPLRRAGWGSMRQAGAAPLQTAEQAHYLLDGWAGQPGSAPEGFLPDWHEALIAQAEAIAAGRLSFFDLQNVHLGSPINWNRDHKLGLDTPLIFAPAIDYRDVQAAGDCKFVWEPSRHHQLVVLGRAYRITGQVRYAQAVIDLITSWMDQCPFGQGMQWRSPMELAIRLINWTFALELIRPAGLMSDQFIRRVRQCVHLHLWDITRKYSRHSSANNHTIGEAAGVYIATTCLADLPGAPHWRRQAKAILEQEIQRQTYADGGGGEQAVGYHLFVIQFLLLAGLIGRRANHDFSAAYWQRLERMFEFLNALIEGGGSVPSFGDGDDGYVLDLGVGREGYCAWLAAAAVVFERPEFARAAGEFSQTAWWLFGPAGQRRFNALMAEAKEAALSGHAFPETGLYLLQSGRRSERISATFDCGPHGLEPLTAHGHADALSITLRAFGVDVLVDPGTYDYFSYRAWREYFRSTRAHNTVEIDGQSQSEPLGLFMWGRRAKSRCLSWQDGRVVGEHDGYQRLSDPVIHRRALKLDSQARRLCIQDEILTQGRHAVALWFHLAEQCRLRPLGPNKYEIDAGPGKITLALDDKLTITTYAGSESPIVGWVSRGYHRKTPSISLVGRCETAGALTLETVLAIE